MNALLVAPTSKATLSARITIEKANLDTKVMNEDTEERIEDWEPRRSNSCATVERIGMQKTIATIQSQK